MDPILVGKAITTADAGPVHLLPPLANRHGLVAGATGSARISVQQMVGFVRTDSDPAAVREVSTRRFGHLGTGLVCGDAAELLGHFTGLAAQRVERFYVWFADFAAPQSLVEFGESVIKKFAGPALADGLR